MTTALQTNQRFVSAVISLLSLAFPRGAGRNAPQQGRIIGRQGLSEKRPTGRLKSVDAKVAKESKNGKRWENRVTDSPFNIGSLSLQSLCRETRPPENPLA
jgi:hypothetical protein